ncbi:MAG: periplasmic heavy metal sensor [Desulfobacteraceae bacterium]|nr:periplasmic heavy metal sensor [Desulfobacteraceae bacterium]
MHKFVHGITLFLILVFVAGTVHAEPQGRWWRKGNIVKALNLTGGEVQRLEKAFNKSKLKMIKLKSRVESEQFKLQNLLEKSSLDETAVKTQNRKLETARSALADERAAFVLGVRKIIGHKRFQKLLKMR